MRFMYDSYDKLFPRPEEAPEIIETAVEGFTPTNDLVHDKPTEKPQVSQPAPATPIAAPTIPQPEPIREPVEEGVENGDVNNN